MQSRFFIRKFRTWSSSSYSSQQAVKYPHGICHGKNPTTSSIENVFDCLKSNSNIYVQGAAATPNALLESLHDTILRKKLTNIRAFHIHLEGEEFLTNPDISGYLRSNSLFTGKNCRQAIADGRADFIPIFLSQIPRLFRQNLVELDFALIQVSPPDEHGFVSLGTSVDATLSAVERAKKVIALVNSKMPRIFGDGVIHLSNIDKVVHIDQEIYQQPEVKISDAEQTIGKLVAEHFIENGSTLQMGIGSVPNAVMMQIKDQKHLGIHSEMISDSVIDLIEKGLLDNSLKKIMPGISVSSFCLGTRRLYNFLNNNPKIAMKDVAFTNDPFLISQNPKVVCINSCLEIDLTGQVVSDSIGPKIYSGVGGQLDFISGALFSRDGLGKAILTLQSRTKKGESKIVPFVKEGAGVVTSRNHVQYIITEFGIASLFGKNLIQRASQLINIAHPDDREMLEKAAFARFKAMPLNI